MQFGIVGLGRMGANMALSLMHGGHNCVAYDRDPERVAHLAQQGAAGAKSIDELVGKLQPPRVIWLMLPAGELTVHVLIQLADHLRVGDIAIDGGNSNYQDDVLRHERLGERGIDFVDCGASTGISGEKPDYCPLLGGRRETVERLDPLLQTLAPAKAPAAEGGYLYCGSNGAGHFVQMVHDGIETGTMQSIAEGFDLLCHADTFGYELPLPDIAEVWRHRRVISSWLPDLTTQTRDADSGEVRRVMESAYARFRAMANRSFAEKMLSAMRLAFSGNMETPELLAR